jgi:GH24 family phage-related lysozyme (muramidase)
LMPGTTALTCFILEYAWPRRWVTPRTIALLSIVPLLCLVLSFTNHFHNQLFLGYEFTGDVVPLYGPVGWSFLVYNLGLRVVSVTALTWLFLRSPQHRWPAFLILMAETVVGIALVLDPYIEESWFFYLPEKAIPVVACAIALFGFRIFDPIPLARQTVIDQLQAGMLVLDLDGHVINMNPATERILNAPAKQVKGKLVKEVLDIGEGKSLRYYMISNSLLSDFRGLEVGRLLLLRDVTEQKRAQAQILEQNKVQAAMEERAGLARELHDNIGQALAVIQVQAETAIELIDRGEIAAAQDTLSRLVEVTQSAISARCQDIAHAGARFFCRAPRLHQAVQQCFWSSHRAGHCSGGERERDRSPGSDAIDTHRAGGTGECQKARAGQRGAGCFYHKCGSGPGADRG